MSWRPALQMLPGHRDRPRTRKQRSQHRVCRLRVETRQRRLPGRCMGKAQRNMPQEVTATGEGRDPAFEGLAKCDPGSKCQQAHTSHQSDPVRTDHLDRILHAALRAEDKKGKNHQYHCPSGIRTSPHLRSQVVKQPAHSGDRNGDKHPRERQPGKDAPRACADAREGRGGLPTPRRGRPRVWRPGQGTGPTQAPSQWLRRRCEGLDAQFLLSVGAYLAVAQAFGHDKRICGSSRSSRYSGWGA